MRPVLGVARTRDMSPDSALDHHHDVQGLLDLSQDEYMQYLRASGTLRDFISDTQLFAIVLWNFRDYYNIMSAYLDAFVRGDSDYLDSRPVHLNINRCLLNYLASVRTYLDHTETSIKRRHGGDSRYFQMFKQYCSDAYDTNFSYRFLYKLRNYAQHCDLPIDKVTFGSGPSKDDPEKPFHNLEVGILRDKLLGVFDWGSLEQEILGLPPTIDINTHIDAMTQALGKINEKLTRDEFPTLLESATYIRALLQRISYDDGYPCVFEFDVKEDNTGKITGVTGIVIHTIPVEIVDAVIDDRIEGITRQVNVTVTGSFDPRMKAI